MESLRLGLEDLIEYQRNRPPYLMIDVAEEVVPGVSARGYKDLPPDTWFFECHFPGDPNMPGLLQTEALVQMAALATVTLPGNKGKVLYLTTVTKIALKRKVVPGDRYDMETRMLSWRRGIGKCWGLGSVDGEKACEAEFNIVMPDLLNEFKVSPGGS